MVRSIVSWHSRDLGECPHGRMMLDVIDTLQFPQSCQQRFGLFASYISVNSDGMMAWGNYHTC